MLMKSDVCIKYVKFHVLGFEKLMINIYWLIVDESEVQLLSICKRLETSSDWRRNTKTFHRSGFVWMQGLFG